MKTYNRYKLELSPYYLAKDEESCDLCANHFYGKFLNYINEEDYVGASLAKRFLRRGSENCANYKSNRFTKHYLDAAKNDKFTELKKDFFCD
jgi:hypothetical protein